MQSVSNMFIILSSKKQTKNVRFPIPAALPFLSILTFVIDPEALYERSWTGPRLLNVIITKYRRSQKKIGLHLAQIV